MIPLAQARQEVFGSLKRLESVVVPTVDALGLVLTAPVVASEPIPPFANTAMDGFAVLARDTVGASPDSPLTLPIVETVAAGQVASQPLQSGQAMRIMTGAPLPKGSDAIIMVELTNAVGSAVELLAEVPVGNHIRPPGDDIEIGVEVFGEGATLGPGHLGVLASLGQTSVSAVRRPRVGVMSTGDELVEMDSPLAPGQIRDSNRLTLLSLLAESDFEAIDLGMVADDEAEIEARLRAGADTCDAVLTSGGVSMGDFDYVKAVLQRLGGFRWMQVAIKPAKPMVFGLLEGTPIFGLPGNPVSSMVSFELFARPGLRMMMGHTDIERETVQAVAAEPLRRHQDGKTHFQRVVLSPDGSGWAVQSAGGQGSHQLTGMATANGLAVLEDGPGASPGETVMVMRLR